METQKITNEEIEYYYNETNHTQFECAQHFGLTVGQFIDLLKKRNIHKDPAKHAEKIRQRKLELYGDAGYNNREKAKATCIEKYGVDNPFKDTEKIRQSYLDKLGADHPMHVEEIKEKVSSKLDYAETTRKARETYFLRTGYTNPGKDPKCIQKMIQSKIRNHVWDSPKTSIAEKRMEKLLKRKFDVVVSHYRDPRYSRPSGYQFECDFYIPEKDLFIELNYHDSHYKCPYNPEDARHIELAEKWKNSTKKWDQERYFTWTVRDKEKIAIARENCLNYLVLYPTSTISENKRFNEHKYAELIEYLLKKLNMKE